MTPWPGVSIVIPSWKGQALLAEFLPSVLEAAARYRGEHGAETEVIVVDDGGGDDTPAWVEERFGDRVVVVARPENGGFAVAANAGFRAARHPVIVLLNNDIRVEPGAIAPLAAHFTRGDLFAVSCRAERLGTGLPDGSGKIGYFSKGHWHVCVNYEVLPAGLPASPPPFDSFFPPGGYAAFDRAKLLEVGGFCELLTPFYWEDVELGYRAWKRGLRIGYEPASRVEHRSGATIVGRFPSRRARIASDRNRLLVHWIHLHDPAWLAAHCLWVGLKLAAAAIVFDFAYWRAFGDALKNLPTVRVLRRGERRAARRTDRELAGLFRRLEEQPWVAVIRGPKDYQRIRDRLSAE